MVGEGINPANPAGRVPITAAAHAAASDAHRLKFEQRATALIVGVLAIALLLCFIAIIIERDWAEHIGKQITAMRDNITYFVGMIGATLGLSWGRGALNQRKDNDGEH